MKKLIAIFVLALFVSGCATHSQKVQIDPVCGAAVNATSRHQHISKPAPNIDPAIDAALIAVDWAVDAILFPLP
jgi:PBP1b-binding outer membrane lipoprotein LpoB